MKSGGQVIVWLLFCIANKAPAYDQKSSIGKGLTADELFTAAMSADSLGDALCLVEGDAAEIHAQWRLALEYFMDAHNHQHPRALAATESIKKKIIQLKYPNKTPTSELESDDEDDFYSESGSVSPITPSDDILKNVSMLESQIKEVSGEQIHNIKEVKPATDPYEDEWRAAMDAAKKFVGVMTEFCDSDWIKETSGMRDAHKAKASNSTTRSETQKTRKVKGTPILNFLNGRDKEHSGSRATGGEALKEDGTKGGTRHSRLAKEKTRKLDEEMTYQSKEENAQEKGESKKLHEQEDPLINEISEAERYALSAIDRFLTIYEDAKHTSPYSDKALIEAKRVLTLLRKVQREKYQRFRGIFWTCEGIGRVSERILEIDSQRRKDPVAPVAKHAEDR